MWVKAKLKDLKIGQTVRMYPSDELEQIITDITDNHIITKYKRDNSKFHICYPIKKLGKPYYELWIDNGQITLC